MNTLLLIIYFLLFLFLTIKNLKWAVFLIIFTLPSYLIRFQIGPLPMTLLEGQILLLFLVFLVKNIKFISCPQCYIKQDSWIKSIKKLLVTRYSLLIILSLFLVAATISMFISPNLRAAAGAWKAYFIEPILFLIVFVSTIKREDIKNVLRFFSSSVLLLSIFALYQKLTGAFIANEFWAAEATRRVTSVFEYPNALALFLTPLIVIFLGVLVQKFKNKKLLVTSYWLLITILGLLAIYWTKSKGALLAILAGIIFYAIFYKGYRKIFIVILIICFIPLFLYFSNPDLLKGTPTVEGGDSITTRIEMWQETWQMLKTKPILGAGLAGYQTALAPFHQKDYIEIYLYPHNIFLNFWTEIGLLGLIAFVLIIIWFYRVGFNVKYQNPNENSMSNVKCQMLNVFIMAGMTALLVHGLVDVPYFKNDLSILFWIIIGLMLVNKSQNAINKDFRT